MEARAILWALENYDLAHYNALNPKKRPVVLRRYILVFGLLFLVACGATELAPTAQPTVQRSDQGRTVITFWHGEGQAVDQALQQLLLGYQRTNPDVEIQVANRGPQLLDDYRQAVLGGGSPDIVLLSENRWIGPLAKQGLIADLSRFLVAEDTAGLVPVALDSARYDDRMFGIPLTLNGPVVFYQANVFASDGPFAATDAWLSTARSLTTDTQYGLAYNLSPYFTQPYLQAWGGQLMDESGALVVTTSSYTATATWLQWIQDLTRDEQLLARYDHRLISHSVQQNQAVMTIDWARNLGDYQQLWGDQVAVRPLPTLSATGIDPQPLVRSSILALNPRSQPQQQQVAIDIVRYLSGPSAQADLREIGQPSVRRDLAAEPIQDAIDVALDQGIAWPTSEQFNASWDILSDMVRDVINGKPIDDTMQAAHSRLQAR